jgi:hypothetical protein
MQDLTKLIGYARKKLGVTNQFQCYNNPQTEEVYNRDVKWIVGADEHRNVVFGPDQLITWAQLQDLAAEAHLDWAMTQVRRERDRRLKETDWQALSDRSMTDAQKKYRQDLRNITETATPELDQFDDLIMSSVTWPTNPMDN